MRKVVSDIVSLVAGGILALAVARLLGDVWPRDGFRSGPSDNHPDFDSGAVCVDCGENYPAVVSTGQMICGECGGSVISME